MCEGLVGDMMKHTNSYYLYLLKFLHSGMRPTKHNETCHFAEMVLPPNANVYYAVNTAFNLNFILRPKKPSGDTDSVGKAAKQK